MKKFFEIICILIVVVCDLFVIGVLAWQVITTAPVWAVILSFVFIAVSCSICIYNEDKKQNKK